MTTPSGLQAFNLSGKNALVTGSSRGLGEGIAKALAGAGATVVLASRGEAELQRVANDIAAAGGQAHVVATDLATMAGVQAAYDGARRHVDRIDILANVAGGNRRGAMVDIAETDFDYVINLNLKGPYFLSQLVGREMIARGEGGKVINIASLTSTIAILNTSVYGATKSGIHALTRSMALEWAPHNIQVNSIAPGYFYTELTRPLFENPERRAWIMGRIPAGRSGLPEDLGGLAVFLAAPASNYITGELINCDGGWIAT